MNELFALRVLTASVNAIKTPEMRLFNRFFRPKTKMQPSDLLQFDVLSGSEKLLGNIDVYAESTITGVLGKKTITMQAPRLAQKRFIPAALLNSYRAMGSRLAREMLKNRLASEQKDMLGIIDRTLEYWAAGALKGKIYDSDLSTLLMDYNLPAAHTTDLTGTDLWSHVDSIPIAKLRALKLMLEDAAETPITGWVAYVGSETMDALINHADVRDMIHSAKGIDLTEKGRVQTLAEIDFDEYNGSFLHTDGTRTRYIETDHMLLIGLCDELTDCPFAPVVDAAAEGIGIGNVDAQGNGLLYFSKAWEKQDPSGRWVKIESRPLPVLKRPGAVAYLKVTA